ncbi:MAG TPA: phage terminase large subunit [Ktedonobacterales bacterium]
MPRLPTPPEHHAPQPTVWALNPAQWRFVQCRERFSFYVGGIGAGKTFAGAVRAILRTATQPGSLGLVGAPTYTMLRDATERTLIQLLPPRLAGSFNTTQRHLRLANGSEILFRSLDEPDRLRGLNLAWLWLDEAPLCGHYAWEVLKGRLRQRGYEPSGWATGTPRGRDGFARDFELAPLPGHRLFRASTRANLHNLPPGYIEDLGYHDAFADQEIEGLFVAFDGLVYIFDASQDGHLRAPASGATFARVIGGVDWGYTNPAAALVFGLDGDRRAWQLAEFYQRRAGLGDVLLPAILELTRTHHVEVWYCGPDEPEHIDALNAALAREGLPCQARPADNAVVSGIQTVTGLLARRLDGTRGLYVNPACTATITEYGVYQYATAASGKRDPGEHPLKQTDHAMDATRYALHTELGGAGRAEAYLADLQGWMDRASQR